MNTCPHCHIRVGGDTAYCPLCQNRLSGPAGEPYFPATAPRIHRASLLYKVVAFVLSALIVVAGAFDFLLMEDTPHRHFSILMAVWAVAVLRVLRAVLRRAVAALSARERQIMELRFGLTDGVERTQKEAADALGISQSYISRLEKRIIHTLKTRLESE